MDILDTPIFYNIYIFSVSSFHIIFSIHESYLILYNDLQLNEVFLFILIKSIFNFIFGLIMIMHLINKKIQSHKIIPANQTNPTNLTNQTNLTDINLIISGVSSEQIILDETKNNDSYLVKIYKYLPSIIFFIMFSLVFWNIYLVINHILYNIDYQIFNDIIMSELIIFIMIDLSFCIYLCIQNQY